MKTLYHVFRQKQRIKILKEHLRTQPIHLTQEGSSLYHSLMEKLNEATDLRRLTIIHLEILELLNQYCEEPYTN